MKKVLITALAVFLACPVYAAPGCVNKQSMYDILEGKYGEVRRIGGHSGFGDIFEFWANASTGTWTVVKIREDGMHCIVDQGNLFYEFTLEPEGDPA